MSLLQRPPIDVNAAIGCDRAPYHLYRSNAALLAAGQTLQPYAGALVRSVLGKSQRRRILDSEILGEQPEFLIPIDRATEDWWKVFPHPPSVTLQSLKLDDLSSDESFESHSDQDIRMDGLPHRSPITAIAILEGSIKYRLSVGRADVFDARNMDYFADDEEPLNPTRRWHEITANAGDILTFTNIPGTWHEGEVVGGSAIRAIYMSHLGRNPVE